MKRKDAKLLLLVTLMISVPALIISQRGIVPVSFASFAPQQDLEYSCPMHPDVKSKKAGSCGK